MDTQHYKDFNFKGLQHVLFIVTTLKIEESKGCGTCNYPAMGQLNHVSFLSVSVKGLYNR